MKHLIRRTLGTTSALLLFMAATVQAGPFVPDTFQLFGQTFVCSSERNKQECQSSDYNMHVLPGEGITPSFALNTLEQAFSPAADDIQSARSYPCARNGEYVHIVTGAPSDNPDNFMTLLGKSSPRYFLWMMIYAPVDQSAIKELCLANL